MNFSFIQITDHHLTPTDAEFLRGFSTRHEFGSKLRHIARSAGGRVDFIVSTGDLVEEALEAACGTGLEMLSVRALPVALPGPFHATAEGLENVLCACCLETMTTACGSLDNPGLATGTLPKRIILRPRSTDNGR